MEMDFNAGFPAEINLTSKENVWNQKLDYESVLFRCRSCFEMGDLAKNCPRASQKNSARKNHHRSTWWKGAQKEHYTASKKNSLEKTLNHKKETTLKTSREKASPSNKKVNSTIPQVSTVLRIRISYKINFHLTAKQIS